VPQRAPTAEPFRTAADTCSSAANAAAWICAAAAARTDAARAHAPPIHAPRSATIVATRPTAAVQRSTAEPAKHP
jgi:hypothetical protein